MEPERTGQHMDGISFGTGSVTSNNHLIDDQIDECVPECGRDVDVDRIVMELMTGPEDVDLVQRPVDPVVDELDEQQRQYPGRDACLGQIDDTVVVV